MDKRIRKFASLAEMKADEYRAWQQLPPHERMRATAEISLATFRANGAATDAPRLQKTLAHLQRPARIVTH